MRSALLPAVIAACGVLAGSVALKAGGEAIIATKAAREAGSGPAFSGDDEALAMGAVDQPSQGDAPDVTDQTHAVPQPSVDPQEDQPLTADAPPVDPTVPVEIKGAGGYERIAPRAPLSELAQAQPPKRKPAPPPDTWKATRLFNPVATSAGTLDAKGYSIALAGIEPLKPDETCTWQGQDWPCGAQGRTAFRAWLRGRAVQCKVPPTAERQLITAECQIGKDDLAAWLVNNGWARAAAGGSYGEAGKAAEENHRGIFGAPPRSPAPSIARQPTPSPGGQAEPIMTGDAPALDQSSTGPQLTPAVPLDPNFPPPPAAPQ